LLASLSGTYLCTEINKNQKELNMCRVHIDTNRAEAFAEELIGMMNRGALTLMISVGHRTGLFDVMSSMPPSTVNEIAEAAGLNERYVREWLGAMTVGKIIECDPEGPYYSLPAEHAAFLTRSAGSDNIAVFTQYISVLGSVEDEVIECFKRGGGVPYSSYRRFHEVMAEDSGQSLVSALADVILPAVPEIEQKLKKGADVLDIGCGRGKAIILLARLFPQSRFTGVDLSKEAIDYASAEVRRLKLNNVEFKVKDLTDFDRTSEHEKYDIITAFDAIHDQARPDNVLNGIYRSLKTGGIFFMQDIDGSSEHYNNYKHPLGALLYTVSTMHCMTVSLAQNGLGLGAMWGKEKALAMLNEAGFTDTEIKNFKHDIQNLYYVNRK
jgi:2-polyprenyl-3-methyl-5-hydroxy-6-metoxy-1,4-benzoquinol methylase